MFLTTLFAYIGSLSPSAQVWCGDQYLNEVQACLAGKHRIGSSNRVRIQHRVCRATELRTEIASKNGLAKLRLAWEYLNACREGLRYTKGVIGQQEAN